MTKKEYIKKLEWSTFTPNPKNEVTLQSWETQFRITVDSEKSLFKNRKKALELFNVHLNKYLKELNIED